MILLERSEVFSISASSFFLFSLPFSYSIFKNGRLSGASFQHNSSNDHYSSGDSNSLAHSQKVMRRMLPEVPGVPLQAISADLYTVSAMKCEITEMPGKFTLKTDFNE